ncbi:MAG TPA: hypothetical protein VFN21_10450 [Acidimicrobiales bacterium]|nr:hypothetical protein [Acidimicrobiales bacterium]
MNGPEPVHPDASSAPLTASPTPTARWWQRDWIAVVVLLAGTALLWFIRRKGPAWAMEEAMMLQAPLRVIDGAVPGRDFDYFYGPLSLLIPAGAYEIASPTLVVARAVGAAYVASIGVGLYFVGRRWSHLIGLAMGTIAVLIGALSMTALPIMGAIGGLVVALAFAVSDLRPGPKAWAVGLAGAYATLLRPEFLLFAVVLLGMLTLTRTVRPVAWLAGAIGLAPYLWPVIGAGFGTTWRNLVGDAMHVASERHLPWHADLGGTGLLAIIGAVTALVAVVLGIRRRDQLTGVALLGLGVFGLCLVPEYLQRADRVHAIYFTMVPLATVVPVSYELLGHLGRLRDRIGWRQLAAVGIAALVVLGLRPKFVSRATIRDARTSMQGGLVYDVSNQGHVWYYRTAERARERAEIVRAAARIAEPGATLFVGPLALDRPTYTDGSFYTLLPEYEQHTHFYDFHPRIGQVDGHRLAADVADADVVILCDTGFDEDNLSARPGSDEAAEVVASQFTLVTRAGDCRLYQADADAKEAS